MILLPAGTSKLRFLCLSLLCLLIWAGTGSNWSQAQKPELLPPPSQPPSTHPVLTLDAAVAWALQRNPELAAIRERHGIAAAAVVIARTYPFNPVLESELRGAEGPRSAGITDRFPEIYKVLLEFELRGQGGYRRQGAYAGLSRTDWEIAYQELLLTGHVIVAFDTVLYRKLKLELLQEIVRLNEGWLKQVEQMRAAGKSTPADVTIARTDLFDARAAVGAGRSLLVIALSDLRRQLGEVELDFELAGSLGCRAEARDLEILTKVALERRADLRAKESGLAEAEAQLGLTRANRYGNPTAGPSYEDDNSGANMFGIQLSMPLPVLNTHRGDIFQREAERNRASLELRQNEIQIRQDVRAAVERLTSASANVNIYQTQLLPKLQDAQKEIENLFTSGATDYFHVIDIRRKLLKARDGYLDVLFELGQASAELTLAVGDPAILLEPCAN
jgi:outer membrane protein TolC